MAEKFRSAINYAYEMLNQLENVDLCSFKASLNCAGIPFVCELEGTDDGEGIYNVRFIHGYELFDIKSILRSVGADAEFTLCTVKFTAHARMNGPISSTRPICECVGISFDITTFAKCSIRNELFAPILQPSEMTKYLQEIGEESPASR